MGSNEGQGLKKKRTALTNQQKLVVDFMKKHVNKDGENLLDIWTEIDEVFQGVEDDPVCSAYEELNSIERIEVIHRVTGDIIQNHKN